MRELHLRQVFIGMESGSDALLRWLRKPSTPRKCWTPVRAAKQGGVRVGVIVLIGAGGEPFFDAHVRDTIQVIRAMQLEPGDYVYLSPLVAAHGAEYAEIAAAEANRSSLPCPPGRARGVVRRGVRQPRGPYVAVMKSTISCTKLAACSSRAPIRQVVDHAKTVAGTELLVQLPSPGVGRRHACPRT